MPLFVPACAYERNPATIEEKRVLCDAALASVLDLLVREQPRPADPLAWVAERLKEWEIQRLGARTAAREAIERVMPRIRAVGRWRGAGEEGKARRERARGRVKKAPERKSARASKEPQTRARRT